MSDCPRGDKICVVLLRIDEERGIIFQREGGEKRAIPKLKEGGIKTARAREQCIENKASDFPNKDIILHDETSLCLRSFPALRNSRKKRSTICMMLFCQHSNT